MSRNTAPALKKSCYRKGTLTNESSTQKIGKAAGTVGFFTGISRIFGLIREQVFAALLGAGFYSDAFVIAFRIPNLLRDLFAEGALASAFVPTFTEYEVKKSTADAWQLANLLLGILMTLLGAITLLGIIFAPALVSVIAPGFGDVPGKRDLTILLTRIMFPFLPAVAIAALFMGMLNVKGKFAIPAFAPVMFNVISIIFGIVLWATGFSMKEAVIGWSIGTLCGGIAQGAVQFPLLRKAGFRWKPKLAGWRSNPGLRQIGLLMLPAVIGLSATNVNILVNSILASLLEQGAPSWLMYSFRLIHLPIGIFGVAIGVVTLPLVSRDAAANAKDKLISNLSTSLNLVLLLTIPSAIGLWILGVPIIRLIFEHGAFGAADTLATASALTFYAIGLPAYAAIKVMAPAFYALKDARAPMKASICAVAVNIIFNLMVYRHIGFRGLALGTSLAAFTNLSLLLYWFGRHGTLPFADIIDRGLRILLSALLMILATAYSFKTCTGMFPGIGGDFFETLIPIGVAVIVYFGMIRILHIPEAKIVWDAVRRILHRLRSR